MADTSADVVSEVHYEISKARCQILTVQVLVDEMAMDRDSEDMYGLGYILQDVANNLNAAADKLECARS